MSDPEPKTQAPNVSFERERGVYAIQVTRDVAHAVVSVGEDALRTARILQTFRALAQANVPVFMVKMHHSAVTFAMAGAEMARAEAALAEAGLEAKTRRDLAVVAVRASSMRDLSGVMVEIADTLYSVGARLYETGDSHNSVQCLVEAVCVPQAIQALCRTFRLSADCVQVTSLEAAA
ncbi:MAG TPA: hypothetical protein VFB38_07090 [Chthonomonadaceae bacterium]|nr:hypothetical protein [Chthonomonadaceae bacterium]